jgi:glycosyltransferase involved in cell wall biosynthesis
MKVLFLNATGQLGGAEQIMVCLLEELRKARPDWVLEILLGDKGPLFSRLNNLNFEVSVLEMPAALSRFGEASSKNPFALIPALAAAYEYSKELNAEIELRKPDVVHSINFKMHLLGAVACWRIPEARLCWHIHDFIGSRFLTRTLMGWLSGRADAIVAISESVAADVLEAVEDPERVHTVLNAIDLDHFAPYGEIADLPAGPNVGLVATFAHWKGHEVFLRAVASLPSNVNAFVVGGELYRTAGSQVNLSDLRRLARTLKIGDRVNFTGFLADPAPLMRSLDVVVHASTEPEPFGLVIAEGMACGRAVVASMAGGAKEILNPGFNGLGHTPGDAAGLASAIKLLIEQPALRADLGKAARASAEKLFDPERMGRQMIEVYEGC